MAGLLERAFTSTPGKAVAGRLGLAEPPRAVWPLRLNALDQCEFPGDPPQRRGFRREWQSAIPVSTIRDLKPPPIFGTKGGGLAEARSCPAFVRLGSGA